ncbi:MAG: SDR family NAD(P)-dependent oxidoreductase [Candidatus Aminicenantes bacterium]|nr:MAG: SDR family NAD(P)-dependent oxidoreductase [Candidatus Aminicenantes bacterium]
MPENSASEEANGWEIAVIGMAGRFPGARNLEEFWENLKNGMESLSFFSDEELLETGISEELLGNPHYVKVKGTIAGIECFDSYFFGYTPAEAEIMDPQLRVCHECAWAALEDAGYNPDNYDGGIGFYAGASPNLAWEVVALVLGMTGQEVNFSKEQLFNKDYLSLQICYNLNLKGPGITLNTTCSTSLVAIDMACKALLTGQCDMALAGGISIMLPSHRGYIYQEGMVHSRDGHIRAFDLSANGTNGGDGVGIVVLKPLDEAINHGDHIYAVIKSTAINNDGRRKVGFTAPSVEGQAEVIRTALHLAEVEPETIGYIESHGTGTPIGDPIEIEALTRAFDTGKKQFCKIGSVKTNVGHLDSAAGIASFIKTVLVLIHKQIPPSLNFKTPNPRINFDNTPFSVNTRLWEWKQNGHPRRAGVSSFGIGGTNAHIILEEAPISQSAERKAHSAGREYQLILLSAGSPSALEQMTGNLANHFRENTRIHLADAAYTLQKGRKGLKHRRILVCSHANEAAATLSQPDSELVHSSVLQKSKPPVIFMFSGQGSQYVNMGLDLYLQEPGFRQEMDNCFHILRPMVNYSLKDILYPREGPTPVSPRQNSAMFQQDVVQPLMFIFEYALARLLMKWGIKPHAMIGYSIGEYVSACLSGVFTLEAALRLVSFRGKLMHSIAGGRMLSVPLTEQQLKPLLQEHHEVSIAVINGPSCIVSGPAAAMDALEDQLKREKCLFMRLNISHAGHSKMMDPMLADFETKIRQFKLNPPEIPYISTVTGKWITVEDATNPRYWTRQLKEPVRFSAGLEELLKQETAVFLEIGPAGDLSATLRQHPAKTVQQRVVSTIRYPQQKTADTYYFLNKIGRLWLYGQEIDWDQLYSGKKRKRIPLPTYPFEKHAYPVDVSMLEDLKKGKIQMSQQPGGKKADIAEWFYLPAWKGSPLPLYPCETVPGDNNWLVLLDEQGVGLALLERLKQAAQDVVIVKKGTGFSTVGPREYTLNVGQESDYVKLFNELHSLKRIPNRIVHLWSIGDRDETGSREEWLEKCQEYGFYSLLYLARSLGGHPKGNDIDLVVVSNNMQGISAGELVYPEKSTLLGVLRVIAHEYPGINCRSVDFDGQIFVQERKKQSQEQLWSELLAGPPDLMAAYRGQNRLVREVEPLPLPALERTPPRLREKGVYLITGGLGGIGLVLAEFLASRLQARLILTGRSPFPAAAEWEQYLENQGAHTPTGAKISKLMTIRKMGGQVAVYEADVTDETRMREVVDEAGQHFGPINGVIHAAGIADGAVIHRLEKETINRVFAPKVKGTLVLDKIFKDSPLDFFLLCSSLGALLGGMGETAYSAANLFLDTYARTRTASFTLSVNWDAWQEVGGAVRVIDRLVGTLEGNLSPPRSRPVSHPLFRECISNGNKQQIYVSRLSPGTHWVLDEHRIKGHATLPGTAYLEMARAALENHARQTNDPRTGSMELSDVYFYSPLMVQEGQEKEVRTVLTKNARAYKFMIISQKNPGTDQWERHAEGEIQWLNDSAPIKHDIKSIRQGFTMESVLVNEGTCPGESAATFGPRWQNMMKQQRLNDNQALTTLELAGEFVPDTKQYGLHPALLDCAIGIPDSVTGAYLPFSYKKVKINGPLPPKIVSHMRYVDHQSSRRDQFLCFDITVMDEQGIPLVDLQEYTLLAVDEEKNHEKSEDFSLAELGLHNPAAAKPGKIQTDLLKDGILPSEGCEVFFRLLGYNLPPNIIISTRDLKALIRQHDNSRVSAPEEILSGISSPAASHPRPELNTAYVAAWTPLEKKITGIWTRILGYETIGLHDDFIELGGNSVKAVVMISAIHKELNVRLGVPEIFSRPTIKELSGFIRDAQKSPYSSIEPVEKKDYYKTSSAQKRLYFLQQMNVKSTSYNLPRVMVIEGDLDRNRLETTFKKLIKRHESLRTSFETIEGKPGQRIHEEVEFKIDYYDFQVICASDRCSWEEVPHGQIPNSKFQIPNKTETEGHHSSFMMTPNHFIRPFDLSQAPIFRVGLMELSASKYILMVDIHHIIADAASMALIVKEFMALYEGEPFVELKIAYKDFSEWQNKFFESHEMKWQEEYWLKRFKGTPPVLNMPIDYPRPPLQSFEGHLETFKAGEALTQGLRKLAKETGTTLFMVLLAAYYILLFKYTMQEDIMVGSPVVGRPHADIENIIGMFANTIVLRNYPKPHYTFKEFLDNVKKVLLEAVENQEYQFEMMVDKLNFDRKPGRNPLFDTMFVLQNPDIPKLEIKNLKLAPYELEHKTTPFDLTCQAVEIDNDIVFSLIYCTKLFKKETMKRLIGYFLNILEEIVENPVKTLAEIEMLSEKKKKQILLDSSNVMYGGDYDF